MQEPDFAVPEPEGFGMPDCTIRKGQRDSTARAYLDPARQRRNLTVVTEAMATRVLVEDGRAVGIEYRQRGETQQLRARREVILCGGAIHSPHLLMLSGIGPAAHLREHGIEVVHDLPGVGRNLQDHPIAVTVWAAAKPNTFDRELRLDRHRLQRHSLGADRQGHAGAEPDDRAGLRAFGARAGPARPAVPGQPHELHGAGLVPRLAQGRGTPADRRLRAAQPGKPRVR